MTTLSSLIEAVKEKNLTKSQLEEYHSELTQLFAQIHLELAVLEKAEAMYLSNHAEKTDVAAKRKWQGLEQGQRLIELKHYSKAVEKLLSSLKNRMYAMY